MKRGTKIHTLVQNISNFMVLFETYQNKVNQLLPFAVFLQANVIKSTKNNWLLTPISNLSITHNSQGLTNFVNPDFSDLEYQKQM